MKFADSRAVNALIILNITMCPVKIMPTLFALEL